MGAPSGDDLSAGALPGARCSRPSHLLGDLGQVVANLVGVVAASHGSELPPADLLRAGQNRQIEVGGQWGPPPGWSGTSFIFGGSPDRCNDLGDECRVGSEPQPDVSTASASRRRTSSNEAIATSIWPRSGCWVVIRCSQSPGAISTRITSGVGIPGAQAERLVGDPGDQRDRDDPRADPPPDPRRAEQREHEDRDDHHDDQEVRAAANVHRGVRDRRARGRAGRRARRRRSSCARRRGTRTPGGCPSSVPISQR